MKANLRLGRELVLEAAVDVLVVPALGRHGVDKTNLDTGKALRHGGRIADDIGDTEVIPGLFAIGRARPTHL